MFINYCYFRPASSNSRSPPTFCSISSINSSRHSSALAVSSMSSCCHQEYSRFTHPTIINYCQNYQSILLVSSIHSLQFNQLPFRRPNGRCHHLHLSGTALNHSRGPKQYCPPPIKNITVKKAGLNVENKKKKKKQQQQQHKSHS